MSTSTLVLFLLITTILTKGSSGLRGVQMRVPHAVLLGSPAVLSCQFLLDGDALYQMKWYKSGNEFYRYTPKETPPYKVFETGGIRLHDIKMDESNATQVSFRQVSGSMAGSYSCEVSADAPSFHTVVTTSYLQVVEIPSGQPVIAGLKPRYRPGQWIFANCTTQGSKPATNLTWTVNGQQVPKEVVMQYREVDKDDMEVSISSVRLLARPNLFPEGRFKIKCIASIYNLYWQTIEKTVEMERVHSDDYENHSELINEVENAIRNTEEFIEQGLGGKSPESDESNAIACAIPFFRHVLVILLCLALTQQ